MQQHQIISLKKRKKEYQREKGIRPKSFQKMVNLKLGISNLLLIYSSLTKGHYQTKKDQKRIKIS